MAEPTTVNTPVNTGNFTITIAKDSTDKAAHTYGAYQLFKGDLAETSNNGTVTKKVLSNVQWGNNIDSTRIATLITTINGILNLTGDNALPTNASAEKVAKAIGDASLTNDSAAAQSLADAFAAALAGSPAGTGSVTAEGTSTTITDLNAGYYLVQDTAAVTAEGAKTRFIMEVVSNVSVSEKASVPSVDKYTDDKNDTTGAEDTVNWVKTADYDLGDVVPYKVVGTLPSTYADYDWYSYKFTDTMSQGLTLNSDSVKIVLFASKADAEAATDYTSATTGDSPAGTDITSLFTKNVTTGDNNSTVLTMSCPVTVSEGTVTDSGLKKNTNITANSAIVMFYTATVNDNAVIGGTGNANEVTIEFSNNPNPGGEGDKGNTPEDKVVVFTLKTVVDKVDDQGQPLTGATFKLYKKYKDSAAVTAAGKTAATKPTTTPTQMTDAEWAALVTGTQVLVDVGEAVLTNNGTTFTFNHMDDGDYVLIETVTPAGYNTMEPYPFSVTASHQIAADGTPSITELTTTGTNMTATAATGTLDTDIKNKSGTQLPSTGGMGTTILYVGGSILVILAAVLLITKRRMNAND